MHRHYQKTVTLQVIIEAEDARLGEMDYISPNLMASFAFRKYDPVIDSLPASRRNEDKVDDTVPQGAVKRRVRRVR